MKKNLLIAVIAISCVSVQAQTDKGRSMAAVTGSWQQSTQKNEFRSTASKSEFLNLDINGRYGYFVFDHLVVGISSGVTFYKQRFETNYDATIESGFVLNGGIFTRYYHLIGATKFAFFGQLGASYGDGTGTKKNETDVAAMIRTDDLKFSTASVAVSPGVAYFINDRIGIEAQLGGIGYSTRNNSTTTPDKQVTKSSNADCWVSFLKNFSFSVNFYFGRSAATNAG